MNAILQPSALGCCPQPAVGREPSAYGRSLEGLKPKTYNLIPERSVVSRSLQVVQAMVCRPLSALSGRKSANHQPGPRNPLTAGGQPVSDSCAPAYSRSLQIKQLSAIGRERSVYSHSLQALLALKPNTQYLKSVRSVVSRSLQALLALKPNTQYLIPFFIFIFVSCDAAMAQEPSPAPAAEAVSISGTVVSAETGEPLMGATVKVKSTSIVTITNRKGEFLLKPDGREGKLEVSFIGYLTKEVPFSVGTSPLFIQLEEDFGVLDEVEINTGYQQLPKERATGSFVQIDNELLQRSVSTDIISRLKGIAPSLAFDERAGGEPKLSIRGRSTIFANDQPLIVLDNFPYEGDLSNINPNDIESISILRDAAAASIWGVRAGNGVIVITTKSGGVNQPIRFDFNSSLTMSSAPDLDYQSRIASSDFIELERFLYEKGIFNSAFSSLVPVALSPVVELLKDRDDGLISEADLNSQLHALGNNDVRRDLSRYFFRGSESQQYSLNISGGAEKHSFHLSSGFDRNLASEVNNGKSRFTIGAGHVITPFKRLKVNTSLHYTTQQIETDGTYKDIKMGARSIYPYARLANDEGIPLSIPIIYRESFVASEKAKGADWTFFPIEELSHKDSETKFSNFRFNTGVGYEFLKGLNLDVKYQIEHQRNDLKTLWKEESYSMRSLYNRYLYGGENGGLTSAIPEGAIMINGFSTLNSQNIRGQLGYFRTFGNHELNVISGVEAREIKGTGKNSRLYGFDIYTGTSRAVNFEMLHPQYPTGANITIPSGNGYSQTVDRFRSYFFNGAYSYKSLYTFSLSGRIDQSNLFGVKANQRMVPLWSVGAKWNLSNEGFFTWDLFSNISLRATYGLSGNLDNTVTALTTAYITTENYTGQQKATISSPVNPLLRWEKIATANMALDFELKGKRLGGSIEYYRRKGKDLMGNGPLDPTNGLLSYKGNVADMVGDGLDIELNAILINRSLQWRSGLLFSTVKDKVTQYALDPVASYFFMDASLTGNPFLINPIVGRPVYGVYSHRWAGLDPETGMPRGYLNGEISDNYSSISSAMNAHTLVYNGRVHPSVFGSLRNSFSYRNLSLSTNLMYKFGYVFRRESINYNNAFNAYIVHADYNDRWKQPGDELLTDVPAMVYPANFQSINFYINSEVLVEKGDHVRLQDIRLSYDIGIKSKSLESLQVYLYANNLGILWRANKQKLDPDLTAVALAGSPIVYPTPRSWSLGLKFTL